MASTDMDPREVLRSRRQDVLALARKHGASSVRVFGSVARGTARPDSDVDLLVEMEPGRSIFDLIALEQDLAELLGRPVQVVSAAGLKPRVMERVLSEAVPV